MNRDAQLSRGRALPPRPFSFTNTRALYPAEPSGLTWIGLNNAGVSLALLNRSENFGCSSLRSRGELIPQLIGALSADEIEKRIRNLDLDYKPFRLIGIFLRERAIREWRWSGEELRPLRRPWKRRSWFSSSLSDAMATRMRATRLRKLWSVATFHPDSLREMHASHLPTPGPFSICMHRSGAATLSYTEIRVESDLALMTYAPGAPCSSVLEHAQSLQLMQFAETF
jgi:hypothetical protein